MSTGAIDFGKISYKSRAKGLRNGHMRGTIFANVVLPSSCRSYCMTDFMKGSIVLSSIVIPEVLVGKYLTCDTLIF